MPFRTLLLEPDGLVGACRQKGAEFPVGRLQDSTIEEIWNSPKVQQWRQEFLDGKPVICERETRHMQCNNCPEFNSSIEELDVSVIQKNMPSRIAFNLNGKCNLECIMCHIWQKPNGLYDTNGFWDQLDSIISNLQEVELLSGEPFIQKDTYKLIDRISEVKPGAEWVITTNVNWKLTDRIKSYMDKIRIKNLIVSIDSLNPTNYSKIRKKGNLDLALETLRNLREYEKDRLSRGLSWLGIRVNFLVQKENWRELGDFYNFKVNEGFEIFRTFLYEPIEHSLLSLSEKEREEILDYYFLSLEKEQLSLRVVLPLIDSLKPIARAQYLDTMRGL